MPEGGGVIGCTYSIWAVTTGTKVVPRLDVGTSTKIVLFVADQYLSHLFNSLIPYGPIIP